MEPDYGHAGALDHAGGTVVTSHLPVPAGTNAGATLRLWTARDGQLTSHPIGKSQVVSVVDVSEITGAVMVGLLLAAVGVLARWSVDRRRMAAWVDDWQSTDPRWTTRV